MLGQHKYIHAYSVVTVQKAYFEYREGMLTAHEIRCLSKDES